MAKLTVERTGRYRTFTYRSGIGTIERPSVPLYRVNVAGIKGSIGALGFRLWVERHSSLGKRLQRNLNERHAVMDELPTGQSYEWIWF